MVRLFMLGCMISQERELIGSKEIEIVDSD